MKGVTAYPIDFADYDWQTGTGLDALASLSDVTFTVDIPDTDIASGTVAGTVLTLSTATTSTKSGETIAEATLTDSNDEFITTFSFPIIVTDIIGEYVPIYTGETVLEAPAYQTETDRAIPPASLAEPTRPGPVAHVGYVLWEQHGYLGGVELDEQDRIVITEIPAFDTALKQKTLGGITSDEGRLFDLPGILSNRDTVVRWPSRWVEE